MNEASAELKKVIQKLFDVEIVPNVVLEESKTFQDGRKVDFASNVALKLAKVAKRSPMAIAKQIAEQIEGFEVEVASPGFLNFILPDEYFVQKLTGFEQDFEKNISCGEYEGKTVVCEFSDPNPFKVLHVGHLYTSVVGDAVSKLVEFAGGKVVRANFGGDVGLHVAKTLYAMMKQPQKLAELMADDEKPRPEVLLKEKSEFMAACYVEGTRLEESDEVARAEIKALNKQIYEISQDGKEAERQSDLAKAYWWGRKISYAYFEDFYKKVGVKFDKYYPESTVAGRGLEIIKAELKKGVYEESDGALVFKGEKYGLHTRVFVNAAGLPTYEAKDVGLIFAKWEDYKFDKSIVITGNDIIDYMKVVLKSIEQYEPELTKRTLHLTHGNVRLPGNEKMSSRKGNFLGAEEVLDLIAKELNNQYDSKDTKVAEAAVKYAFLKYKIGGNIIFDIKNSVSMTGNAGPYLQYAAVRAQKVMGNLMKNGVGQENENWQMNKYERDLMKKVVEYPVVLQDAVKELAPHKICNYLYELAQNFSRFYEQVKVAGSEYEFERGKIVLCYLKVLTHGLEILGIKVPEKM